MTAWVLIGFIGALIMGIPVAFAVAIGCIIVLASGGTPLVIIAQKMVDNVGGFTMLAMPLFILSGNLMAYGSTPRLMKLANLVFRKIPGGLGAAGIGACGFFGAVSGSGIATTAAIGSIVGPEMESKGYGKGYTTSIMAAAGTLGGIIPPSITMVLFATAASLSVGKSLLAGLVPGVFVVAVLIVLNGIVSKRRGYGAGEKEVSYPGQEKRKILVDALLPLMMPVIILGSVFSGVITSTESACIAVIYAFFLAVFVYKDLNFTQLMDVIAESAISSAGIMIIISASGPFGYVLTINNVATKIATGIASVTSSPIVISLLIIVFLIILGMFLEGLTTVVMLTPILLPLATSIGMDPYHFGVMFALLTCIGSISPPMATCLFTSCRVMNCKVQETFPDILMVMGTFLLAVIILWCIPQLTTFLVYLT